MERESRLSIGVVSRGILRQEDQVRIYIYVPYVVQISMERLRKILPARFFCSATGKEPVRTWLKELEKEDRLIIGGDIRDVELSWPIGMPLCRALQGYKDLWEIRSRITRGRIARVIFYTKDGEMILLHGFVKKAQKTPRPELELAVKRKQEHERHG
jgi:phage-related protein